MSKPKLVREYYNPVSTRKVFTCSADWHSVDGGLALIPASEPGTPQFSLTIQASDFPAVDGNIPSNMAYDIVFMHVVRDELGSYGSIGGNYKKNGTSYSNGTSGGGTSYTYRTVSLPHNDTIENFYQNVVVGDNFTFAFYGTVNNWRLVSSHYAIIPSYLILDNVNSKKSMLDTTYTLSKITDPAFGSPNIGTTTYGGKYGILTGTTQSTGQTTSTVTDLTISDKTYPLISDLVVYADFMGNNTSYPYALYMTPYISSMKWKEVKL